MWNNQNTQALDVYSDLKKNNFKMGKKKNKKNKAGKWIVIGILAVICGVVFLPKALRKMDWKVGAKVPAGYESFYLDLSHHNGYVVWDSLRVMTDRNGRTVKDYHAADRIVPLSGVFMKVTEGERFIDDAFPKNWERAKAFRRGAYHYFMPDKDPAVQAKHYINHVQLRHSDLPPMLDVETIAKDQTREELSEKVLVWLKAVEKKYRRKPIVYASDSFTRDYFTEEILDNYPLWIARYNAKKPELDGWQLWQFTDKAVLPGIKGLVDLSVGSIPE